MSATNRIRKDGEATVRDVDDDYATPSWCVRAIAPYVVPDKPGATVLDPCAGRGNVLLTLSEIAPWIRCMGVEIDMGRAKNLTWFTQPGDCCCTDALGCDPWPKTDLVLTNPPYRRALDFVVRALEEGRDNETTVAMLLRLNFLGSQQRSSFWKQNPCEVYVLSRRPSFTGKGTDATEYAWFVWGPGRRATWQTLDPSS